MRRSVTAAVVAAVAAGSTVAAGGGPAAAGGTRDLAFERVATYPVYLNRPAGEDPATETVAEISAVTRDGRTVIYTDAPGQRIGFLDISRPDRPRGLGTLSVERPGDAEAEPTAVAVVGGYALVVVNTSPSFTAPSGRLDVVRVADRRVVRTLDLGGQPDSIGLTKDGRYAAIAIENERDEEAAPPGGEEGDLPQPPAGFVQVLDTRSWTLRKIELPAAALAGLAGPTDAEPEYVSVNSRGLAAVTLQENNGIALVDLPTATLRGTFGAGTATVTGIDTEDDGTIDQTGSIVDIPREPDSVAWVDDRYLATANEGDWRGGTRGWTVFDSRTGAVVWDAGNSIEKLAVTYGLHDDSRSDNKGVEPEGLAVATVRGVRYGFVGSERSNFVAVYDLSDPRRPEFRQVLPTTNGPEGLLPVPARGLFVVSSETDDAEAGIRATVGIYRLGRDTPAFPSIASRDALGWGALGALSAKPGAPGQLYTVTDAAYSPTRILTVDTGRSPALITRELTVTAGGQPVGYDAEGLYARPTGGFWLGVEGATGAANQLVRLDRGGNTVGTVPLPADVAAGLTRFGIEGVTATTDRAGEHVFVVLQRELSTDPAGVARIGRYDVATGAWTWFGYRLQAPPPGAGWVGLSEVTAVDRDTLAVIERDDLAGPDARVKRVYTVDLPRRDPAAGTLPVLPKRLALDVLPRLRATNGWTQEKLEGLTIGGDGRVYAVTDNDALEDATGETVFLRLGRAARLFQ